MSEYEPIIVAFGCTYCAFAAADLAGSMRRQYPPNIRIVRLPCSGRAEIQEILDAFVQGADGVLVIGCMEGDCHFINGNIKGKRRVARARALLEEVGIAPERLEFRNNSAAMGPRLAEIFTAFTERIRALGPLPGRGSTPARDTTLPEPKPKPAAGVE